MAAHVRTVNVPEADRRKPERRVRDKGTPAREVERGLSALSDLATHKHPAMRAWLNRHPRVQLHFTATSGTWLNLVEAFFSTITRKALRRGNFPTVAGLIAAIERFIAAWNNRCRPSPRPRIQTPSSPRQPARATARDQARQLRSTRPFPVRRINVCTSASRADVPLWQRPSKSIR